MQEANLLKRTSFSQSDIRGRYVFQQDIAAKHMAKTTWENKKVLQWEGQSVDLSPIEIFLSCLKIAVHEHSPYILH